MVQIRLMPTGSLESLEHLYNTVINPISKSKIKEYFGEEEFSKINESLSEKEVAIWGLEPGKFNEVAWKNFDQGDIVIFVPSNEDLIIGELRYKAANIELAKSLLGSSERSGQFWEFLIFVKILGSINLDKRSFLTQLGYSEQDNLQANRDVTDKFLSTFLSIENFISKYSKDEINLEFYRNMTPKQMFERKGNERSKSNLTREELKEKKNLEEELPKLESLVGIFGFPSKEQLEIKKDRLEELRNKENIKLQ
ncbi:MAG: hypothetical protein WAU65_02160 [Candidatus Nanoarchaeia archaeon]